MKQIIKKIGLTTLLITGLLSSSSTGLALGGFNLPSGNIVIPNLNFNLPSGSTTTVSSLSVSPTPYDLLLNNTLTLNYSISGFSSSDQLVARLTPSGNPSQLLLTKSLLNTTGSHSLAISKSELSTPPLPEGLYEFNVYNSNNAWYKKVVFKINLSSLGKATNLDVKTTQAGANYNVILSWKAVPGAETYTLGISDDPATPYSQYIPIGGSSQPTLSFNNVAAGKYYLAIIANANNGALKGPIANFDFTVPTGGIASSSLAAPTNLQVTTTQNGASYDVTLTWDVVSGAQGYLVGVTDKPNPVDSDYLLLPAVFEPKITVPGVAAGTYNLAIVAGETINGQVAYGNISKFTVVVPVVGQEVPVPPQEELPLEQQGQVSDIFPSNGQTQTTQNQPAAPTFKLPVDIIKCSIDKNIFYLDSKERTFDQISLTCGLSHIGIVSFGIYKANFDPKKVDNSASLIRMFLDEKSKQPGQLRYSWNGKDDYDQVIAAGDYVFVAQAKPDSSYLPDISVQKFKVMEGAPATGLILKQVQDDGTGLRPAAAILKQVQNDRAGKPSKCPGVNYPFDLPAAGARFEQEIIKAYDLCLVSGFPDGTFRAESTLTRAQATKIVLLARGSKPKEGCYNLTCGSPFYDLDLWQGKYIRAAWDERIIVGMAPGIFEPNRETTRAEAASLVVKALNIPPHQGCRDAHCGAGYPSNIFYDIVRMWEGPFVRALWDRGAAMATGKNTFSPERAIKRGEFLEMVLRAKG